jgi:arsenate reductase
MTVTIYHNPRCSKSRQTLDLLRSRGIEPKVVLYLETPPSAAELGRIVAMLGVAAKDIVRRKEAKEAGIDVEKLSDGALLEALARHPAAIERPIVVKGSRAALGRPPENVLKLV